jgi:hypothetical protein
VQYSNQTYPATGIVNGRTEWKIVDGSDYKRFFYAGSVWRYEVFMSGEGTTYDSAATDAFRPEQANWSASGLGSSPTTSSTFGIVRAATNEPRFDHDSAGVCRGLLIEESRTNLVFPSDALTTQTRTVTAVAHTLSFYGTGTVVLSGAHSATVVGTGAYPTRTTLTFTPTAGSLTLTVTGSVTQAQLEAGSFPTSYIPTTTGSVVRSADVCSITGANFTSFYNQSEGTLFADVFGLMPDLLGGNRGFAVITDGTYNNAIGIYKSSGAAFIRAEGTTGNVAQFSLTNAYAPFTQYKVALGVKTNDTNAAFNGSLKTTDTSVTLPSTMNRLEFRDPTGASGGQPSCHLAAIRYYKKRLPNAKLVALTT